MLSRRPYFIYCLPFALLLSACGGGGGGGSSNNNGGNTNPPPTNPPPPTGEILVPTQTPVLFLRSSYQVPDGVDTIEQYIHLIAPETGEVRQLRSYTTHSFSNRDLIAPLTFDDQLIVLTNQGNGSGIDGGEWWDVDTDAVVAIVAGAVEGQLPTHFTANTDYGSGARNCVAVSGTNIFWQTPSVVNGGLKTANFNATGTQGDLLIPQNNSDACFGILASKDGNPGLATRVGGMDYADGQWYDTRFDPDLGAMEFYTRDAVTGLPTLLASYTPPDHNSYNRAYSFAYDNGRVYWTRVHAGNQQVEIWSYDFVGMPVLLEGAIVDGVDVQVVSQFDVDDGRMIFMVGDSFTNNNIVFFYDEVNNDAEIYNLEDFVPPVGGVVGPNFSDLRIMFRDI